ncbi:MAG: universal stress protein [Polyangiaceae bacterium]
MFVDTILVGTDFSDLAHDAIDWAIELGRALHARVVVAHVFDLPIVGFPDASFVVGPEAAVRMLEDAQRGLDAEVARVCDRGVPVEAVLRQGDARDVLPAIATSMGAGLLVVGSHGRRGLARALLGSVAEGVARASASIPVTVVHSKK